MAEQTPLGRSLRGRIGRDAVMAAKPLRLLHAANLQLDCPLQHVAGLHDDARDIIDIATLTAFDRLVSLAIERDVDALLITGNSFDASVASLPAEVALRNGFERLDERQIPVFVTPGKLDPASAWLELPALPANVTLLTDLEEPPIDLTDRGRLLATLLPVTVDSSVEPYELDNLFESRASNVIDRPFVVGLLLPDRPSVRNAPSSRFAALDWLACSVSEATSELPLTDAIVNAQAGPQGMSFKETGPRGATLLEVDAQRRIKQTLIPLAPVRWERITQSLDGVRNRDDLLERMLAAVERLSDLPGELLRFIDWKLDRTSGEANGWEADAAVTELSAALTQLTDQPEGLRYVHRVRPLDPDLSLIESGHRELLTEYLLALDRRSPVTRPAMSKWLADGRIANTLKTGRWESWSDAVEPATVASQAQQLGWDWFTAMGQK